MPNIADAKCVLVIGATAGIGRALALAIRDLPSKPTVVVGGRRQERIDELCKEGDRIEGVQVDVMKGRDKLKAFVDETVTKYPEVYLSNICMPSETVAHYFGGHVVGRGGVRLWRPTHDELQ